MRLRQHIVHEAIALVIEQRDRMVYVVALLSPHPLLRLLRAASAVKGRNRNRAQQTQLDNHDRWQLGDSPLLRRCEPRRLRRVFC